MEDEEAAEMEAADLLLAGTLSDGSTWEELMAIALLPDYKTRQAYTNLPPSDMALVNFALIGVAAL